MEYLLFRLILNCNYISLIIIKFVHLYGGSNEAIRITKDISIMKKFSIKQTVINNMPTLMYWLDKNGLFTLKECQAHDNAHSMTIYCENEEHAKATMQNLQTKFN